MNNDFESYDLTKLHAQIGTDPRCIEDMLSIDNPQEFSNRLRLLIDYVTKSSAPNHRKRLINYIEKAVISKEHKLDIRFLAIDALSKIGHDDLLGASAVLHTICTHDDEPLRLRWAAFDVLKVIKPDDAELMEKLNTPIELFDRTIDPDNPPPKLDFSKELERKAKKDKRFLNFVPLIALFIFGGIIGTYFSFGTRFFRPIISSWIVIVISFIIWSFVWPRRCPKCKRYFARSPLKYKGGYDSKISMPIGSLGPGGSPVHTRHRVNIYQVRC